MSATTRVLVRSMHLINVINSCERLRIAGVSVIRVDQHHALLAVTDEQRRAIEACGFPLTNPDDLEG